METLGLRIAGWTNILGVLTFSLAFSNERLSALSPVVFSRFGLVAIMLWGAAYLASARRHRDLPGLMAVFALEKFVYVATWVLWLQQYGGTLPTLFADDPLTATFYAIYGPLDFAFGVFFALLALRGLRSRAGAAG